MPRHDPANTPPELRRAPRGSAVGELRCRLTLESRNALEALKAGLRVSEAEAVRRALLHAASTLLIDPSQTRP